MKLLMLTHRFPFPPTRGDSIRAWGELEHLARRHDVWLACVDRTAPQAAHLARVRSVCREVEVAVRSEIGCMLTGGMSLLCGHSLTAGYFRDLRLRRTLQAWSDRIRFDAVLTFSSAMSQYVELVHADRRVLDMNDVDSAKWRTFAARAKPPVAWLYALEARRLARVEADAVRGHDVCLLVNQRERRRLVELTGSQRIAVVRTGVDLTRYESGAAGPNAATRPVVGMIGSMSYAPNVRSVNWFGRQVWPRIKLSEPRAEWLIVGSRPTRSVRRWGRLPGVSVTGFVKDMRPWLESMRVVANPVADEIGVQTKLIETLAMARPAVVTPAAAAGIDYSGEPPFLIAESPELFARSVLRLIRDESLAKSLSRRAHEAAQANYRVEDQIQSIERWLQARNTIETEAEHDTRERRSASPAAPHGKRAGGTPAHPVKEEVGV